jgi:DNA-binding LytR/AlgR family response regulator
VETILLPDFTIKRSVSVASIEYIEAMGNYSLVHVRNQKPLLVAITLKRLSERLPAFLRIHKGILVNPDYIVAYHTRYLDTPYVQLSKNRQLPISRRQIKQLRAHLAAFPVISPARGSQVCA